MCNLFIIIFQQKARREAEHDRDELQSQLQTIKDLLLAEGGKTINNETIDRIRTLERIGSLRRENRNRSDNGSPVNVRGTKNIHEGGNAHVNPVMAPIEESCESLLDASDLSFDDTQGDFLDGSRHPRNEKRSSAGRKRSMIQRNAGKMEQKLLPKAIEYLLKMSFNFCYYHYSTFKFFCRRRSCISHQNYGHSRSKWTNTRRIIYRNV